MAGRMFGLLGPDALMSLCTDLTDADIVAVVSSDTRIVHKPVTKALVKFVSMTRRQSAVSSSIIDSDLFLVQRGKGRFDGRLIRHVEAGLMHREPGRPHLRRRCRQPPAMRAIQHDRDAGLRETSAIARPRPREDCRAALQIK
jgi:hypothetical protein